jgi:predicted RNA-binding Zn-ribbon protein involved in translation (DUF1610 family)
MSEQPMDAATLVPAPTPPPAEQELSGEEILAFDPQATVAAVASADAGGLLLATAPEHLVDATCPSCGTVGRVDYARREADAFCVKCDFPLFWSVDRIVLPANGNTDERGLRRLPGTAGRAALASLLCPACQEPNPATGVTCVRCGALLHPVAPEPVVVAPEPEPEPEPVVEAHRSWWPLILAGGAAVLALVVVLLVLYA